MTNRWMMIAPALVLFVLPVVAFAEPMDHIMGGGPRGIGGPPTFLEHVFPPSMIMRHQSDIGLTDAQREVITKHMEEGQKGLVGLQWEVERESEKLSKLLEGAHIDEAVALRQVDRVMGAEERLKKAHLTLLIRIKNELTPVQQDKLRQLRPARGNRFE